MDKPRRTIWEFFIDNYKFTYILIVAVVCVGFFSIWQMPKEANPEVDIPIAVVTTAFPGASAENVEELITDPIEDRLVSLDEVDEITSVSRNGLSMITVQFDVDTDSTEKLFELKDKVDQAKADLPDDAKEPVVHKVSFSDRPILTLALSGPFELAQLKQYAEQLKDETERIAGVSNVHLIGGLEREIKVVVNKAQLESYSLPLTLVTQAIHQANTEIPSGSIETGGENFMLRLAGGIKSADEIKQIPITVRNNVPILVKDIAKVIDGYSEIQSISRLSVNGEKTNPSVSLKIFKASGGDVLRIIEAIHSQITQAQESFLPESIVVETIEDNAQQIKKDLGDLLVNGFETIVIVMILLFIFLGWREALLAGIAIPISFLITFSFLAMRGDTLNMLTLFSLILALGILIDGAIVITESIHVERGKGKSTREAAIKTIREFQLPLMAGTLTTVFAFFPMMLTSGIMGKFIESIPITVSIVLLSSLFVALGIITTLSVRFLKNKNECEPSDHVEQKDEKKLPIQRIRLVYRKLLHTFLFNHRRAKLLNIGLILLFVFSISLPATGVLKVNMFPQSDEDTFTIDIEEPIGTPLETMDKLTEPIQKILYEDKRINSFAINIGSSSEGGSILDSGSVSESHLAHFIVNLDKERKERSTLIVDEYQKKFGIQVKVSQKRSGPSQTAPVEIVISGDSLDTLEGLGEEVETVLTSIEGTRNIKNSVKETNGEFVLHIDRIKAKLYGVSTEQLAATLRNAIAGTTATVIHHNGNDIDVLVKYALNPVTAKAEKTNQVDISTIENLTIATNQGNIPLSSFIESKLLSSRSAIEHKNGNRVVKVTSYTQGKISAQEIFAQMENKLEDINIPDGYIVSMGGEREDIQESFSDMFRALILGVFMIAALLVWQFRSYRQPLFILITIPLALIGVLPGLTIMNQPLSFPGIIGIVALAGIVVNNGIILIDRINKNRLEGLSLETAIEKAGAARLQPILLTTVTTIAGVLPLAISNPVWGPLGYSIVFGLMVSGILTLLVVPLLYQRFGEKELGQVVR